MGRITWRGQKREIVPKSALAAHIGQKLLGLRQKHQLALRHLAADLKMSQAFLCDMENGRQCPGAETLWKLAKRFDVSVAFFFHGFTDH
jgi:transcriptional regulator with XRE-family HTH domain